MYIADMAAAGGIGAGAGLEDRLQCLFVEVAEFFFYKVTAVDISFSVDADDRMPGAAVFAFTGVMDHVVSDMRIDGYEPGFFFFCVIVLSLF